MMTSAPALPVPAPAAAVPVPLRPKVTDPVLRRIRALVWVFIGLWIIEGALRKWIFPELANPLLVVRDPVLLLIYLLSFGRRGIFPMNGFVVALLVLGGIAAAISLVVTHTSMTVVLFGFRANFLHLPLIFLLPRVLDREDVVRIGRWFLLVAIPMAVLVLGQFRAGRDSWLNAGAGGGLNGQMDSAMGHVRASGTFSFTNGLVGFAALVMAFFLYRLLFPRIYPKWLWFTSGGALVVMITLSGNRALVGVVVLTVAALGLASLLRPVFLRASGKLLLLGLAVFIALGSFAVFRQGLNVFADRFGDEEAVKTGFLTRYFQSMTVAPLIWEKARPEGFGLGMGTNAAAGLLSGGKRNMLLAEGEWDRMVLELGPVLGCLYLAMRVGLTVYILRAAWVGMRRGGDPLALLLAAGCYSDVLCGQLTQPTALGFVCIAGGLTLAATRAPVSSTASGKSAPAREAAPHAVAQVTLPTRRGRSVYAELLHGTAENPPSLVPDPEESPEAVK